VTHLSHQQRDLPRFSRLRNSLIDFRQTRDSYEFEWLLDYDAETHEFEIETFTERVPARIDLYFTKTDPVHVDRLRYFHGKETEDVNFGVRTFVQEPEMIMQITPACRTRTSRIRLRLADPPDDDGFRIHVRVVGKEQDDVKLVMDAHSWAHIGDFETAIDRLGRYEKYATHNPLVSCWMSDWYQQRNDFENANRYAVNALRRGNVDACASTYRGAQRKRALREVADIRALQEQARQWDVGDHHGLLVLEKRQRFELGLEDRHLRKCNRLIEIRRPAAARMLNALSFPFSASREYLLYTRIRIIHQDGSIEEVPEEQFTVGDDERKSIFITVEDEKVGHWILPDLVAGDVIDWLYHLVCRDDLVKGEPRPFILTGLFDSSMPTFRGLAEFVANAKQPARFQMRNSDIEGRHTLANENDVTTFEGERFVPARRTGYVFENQYLNPTIICSSDDIDWQDVVESVRKHLVGKSEIDELPEALASLVDEGTDRTEVLENAFYWIRDRLKYATTHSGVKNIGEADRARKIVESGVGNCNDKSYLLSLVCQRLELPYEFVSISTKNGILIEEAPADQFDHVFVRAQTSDGWIYLDAVGTNAFFGSPPVWCQGLQALAIGDKGTIITIPTDSPEANAIEISEVLDSYHDGWAHGRFEIRANGHTARLLDERWKTMSLELEDKDQSGQEALRELLPSSVVKTQARESDARLSGVFHVSGEHSRGPLVHLGNEGGVIGTVAWEIPFIPASYWRILQISRLFVMQFPVTVRLDVQMVGGLYRSIGDVSRIQTLDNPVCSIREDLADNGATLRVTRTIEIKKKHIHGEEVSLVPEAMERIEGALQLVISLDGIGG